MIDVFKNKLKLLNTPKGGKDGREEKIKISDTKADEDEEREEETLKNNSRKKLINLNNKLHM